MLKLPSWLATPIGKESQECYTSNQKGPSSRRKKIDSALGTDSEGAVTSTASLLCSTPSMRKRFTRPPTSTLFSTRPSLPPEIYVLIFQRATSPLNPS
ncbi:hypothetical protein BKA70DRAFT_1448302 [Coprinopsis sp. MPI-PUGE-AT-0042]|nr:hypothetical protein BKA70DRAFT_1448302 [Coprinopsis sp. MPI-PUGE-AT-0042]